jgi:hypothetical protein
LTHYQLDLLSFRCLPPLSLLFFPFPIPPIPSFPSFPFPPSPNLQLPWSTSNEDLVELFETTGEVVAAEILFDVMTGRSRGSGIVEFTAVDQSTTAIAKFTGYVYGGRPLDVRYNSRFHKFTETAARAGGAGGV